MWKNIKLDNDELVIYINEKEEQQFFTVLPFDDEKYYKVIIFDYSS